MEILLAILTAIFFWSSLCYMSLDANRRACHRAGPLVLRPATPDAQEQCWRKCIFGAVMGVVGVAAIAFLVPETMCRVDFGFCLCWTVLWYCRTAGVYARHASVELRQNGILRPQFQFLHHQFTPWTDIGICVWVSRGTLSVRRKAGKEVFRLELSEMVDATDVLTKYVEVRDATGELSAEQLRPPVDVPVSTVDNGAEHVASGRYQFNLTALLLLMLLASSAFSWYGIRYRQQERLEEGLALVEPFSPAIEVTSRGVSLDFIRSTRKPDDAELQVLGDVEQLWWVRLQGAPITDAGLVYLGSLRKLVWLDVTGTDVTDAGLVHLKGMRTLVRLELTDTKVTDAGLVHLEKLTKLRLLYVDGTQVTEEGVRRLQEKLPDVEVRRQR